MSEYEPKKRYFVVKRPTNLKKTPQKILKVLEALSNGATDSQAADSAGVCRQTFASWRDKDVDFFEKCAMARAQYSLRELNPKLADKDPYRYLKALYPEDFKETPTVQQNVLLTQVQNMPDDELEAAVKRILLGAK